MKLQTLLILMIFCSVVVSAQRFPQGQGTYRTSGSFSFLPVNDNSGSLVYRVAASPAFGYFFSDNAMGGIGINYSALIGKNVYDANFRLSPLLKYYFIVSQKEFLIANFTYNFDIETDKRTEIKAVQNNSSVSVGPGISYFFTRRIGIEANLLYNIFFFPDDTHYNKFSFVMGFNVNIPKSKQDKTDK